MAVFLLNICKFNKCGLEFGTLVDLIQHIEENHIGKLSLKAMNATLRRPSLSRTNRPKNWILLNQYGNSKVHVHVSPPSQIMIQSRSPTVFHWAVFSDSSRMQRARRTRSSWWAQDPLSHSTARAMPASGWKSSAKSPSNLTATVCRLRIEVILQQVRIRTSRPARRYALINHTRSDERWNIDIEWFHLFAYEKRPIRWQGRDKLGSGWIWARGDEKEKERNLCLGTERKLGQIYFHRL